MDNNQVWINLSNKEFEQKRYENNRKTTGYFKMATGLWFSLPTENKNICEWGDFLADELDNYSGNEEFFNRFIDNEGQTNITSVQLKDTTYIVHLDEWKQTILEVLNSTPYELSSDEKRKILLQVIRIKTGNEKIEHLIFDIKEREFGDIKKMYYSQNGEEIKRQKYARDFDIADDTLKTGLHIMGINRGNYEEFKKRILLKIGFLERIQRMTDGESFQYEELEKFFSDDDKDEIEGYKLDMEFDGKSVNENSILQHIISYNKRIYGLSIEILEQYKNFISHTKTNEDYCNFKPRCIERNGEITWLVDYFSGCVNEKHIPGYDMPSLAIFDTDCISILSQRKEKTFERKTKEREGSLSAEQIGSALKILSRQGLTDTVQADLISMGEEKDKTEEREQQ